MKKIIIISVLFWVLPAFLGMSWAGQGDKKKFKQKRGGGYERVYRKDHPIHHKRNHHYKRYNKRHNDRYRGHKYDRHYSWHQWRHHRHEPRYRRGKYHHDDNGYLMFSYCEGEKRCFSISID